MTTKIWTTDWDLGKHMISVSGQGDELKQKGEQEAILWTTREGKHKDMANKIEKNGART
jgi:hypothetical protein